MKKILTFCLILIACIGCDQTAKSLAKTHLHPFETQSYFYDMLRLQYAENTGAMYGLGSDLAPHAGAWILIIGPSLVLLGLLVYVFISDRMERLPFAAFSLIFAGGASNMLDRIFNDRSVIDFLNVGIGEFRTAIFNLADFYIMTGIVVLIAARFFVYSSKTTISESSD